MTVSMDSCAAAGGTCRTLIRPIDWPWPLPKIHYVAPSKTKKTVKGPTDKKQSGKKSATSLLLDGAEEDGTTPVQQFDVANWKEQDHYALLGLGNERYLATEGQIKKAYRMQILRHHPDKKSQAGEIDLTISRDDESAGNTEGDGAFKCIQKAYEILSDPVKRRQYDSVDPTFDDSIPARKTFASHQQFFSVYAPIFESNARFSKNSNVPSLGSMSSTRVEVESFYEFWYNFDSWRSFEYLDKEECQGDNRYDRRYYEQKNKAARTKLKTEDNARLRKLIDQAVEADPRIKLFKEQDKLEKNSKKNEKKLAEEALKLQKQRELELAKQEEEKRQAEEKEKMQAQKAIREAEKNLLRKHKRAIKQIFKDEKYFVVDPKNLVELEKNILYMEGALEKMAMSSLTSFMEQLTLEPSKGMHMLKEVYASNFQWTSSVAPVSPSSAVPVVVDDKIMDSVQHESSASPASMTEAPISVSVSAPVSATLSSETAAPVVTSTESTDAHREWTVQEVQELIKAANKIPGGTRQRWEKIAEFVSVHANAPTRTTKEVIEKSNELLKGIKQGVTELPDEELQKVVKKKVDPRIYDTMPSYHPEKPVVAEDLVSSSTNKPAEPETAPGKENVVEGTNHVDSGSKSHGTAASTCASAGSKAWSKEEQVALEAALKKYPAQEHKNDRWDLVSACIPTRSKKEILVRVKELAAAIQSKKCATTTGTDKE